MRSGSSEWQGCVTPIPKDARAEFEKARGEFCAYPTGRSERFRASRIWQKKADWVERNQPGSCVSDIGSKRFAQAGIGRAATQWKPWAGGGRGCRSFLFILLRGAVASAAGCQRGLGIDSLLAIDGPRRAGDGSGITSENGTRTSFGAGPPSSPGSQAGRARRGAFRRAGA
jgi:hypothetical protein